MGRNKTIQPWRPRYVLPLLWICAGLCFLACDDDDPNPPPVPDLQNIWPNEDGRYWVYAMDRQTWVQTFLPYATPEMVPAAPTLDEAITLLQAPLTGDPVSSREYVYRMQFDGRTTTVSGAEGQNLAAFVDDQPVNVLAPVAERFGVSPGLLAQLWRARPEVRSLLSAAVQSQGFAPSLLDSFDLVPATPTFLSGGAWEKSDSWIGLYKDLDLDLGWKYLEADLQPGHEFTFQPVKSLADDVFLHARVNRRVTVRTADATYVGALEVIYLVDFGITMVSGPLGEPIGYTRPFSLGVVTYAPLVGPVWNEERSLYQAGDAEPEPLMSQTLDLQARGRTR